MYTSRTIVNETGNESDEDECLMEKHAANVETKILIIDLVVKHVPKIEVNPKEDGAKEEEKHVDDDRFFQIFPHLYNRINGKVTIKKRKTGITFQKEDDNEMDALHAFVILNMVCAENFEAVDVVNTENGSPLVRDLLQKLSNDLATSTPMHMLAAVIFGIPDDKVSNENNMFGHERRCFN